MANTAFIRYGAHDHDVGEAMFHFEKFPVIGQTGRVESYRVRITQQGCLQAADNAALTTLIQAVEAEYLNGGKDWTFMLDNATASAHVLLTADCLNGTVVHPIQWLGTSQRGSGVEYAGRRRSYKITIEGDVDPGGQDTDIVYWTETIRRRGTGGPNWEMIESLAGTVESQQTNAFTKCATIQEGVALGRTAYPTAAAALWGVPYFKPRPAGLDTTAPRGVFRNAQRNYGRRWQYFYESDVPLVGGPTEFTP